MSKSNKKSYFIRRFRLFLQRNYAVLIALPVVLFAGYYTLCIEPEQLRITEYTFCHEKVTPQLDGTVIALVTDIHYNTQRCQLWQKAIQAINRRSGVECILLGGDLINGSGKALPASNLLKTFQQLKSRSGVFSIPGNHEYRYRQGGISAIKRAFAEYDQIFMQDENLIITTGSGGVFNLTGLDFKVNPHERKNPSRVKKLLREDMLNIVLTHTPEDYNYLPSNSHLILAGHTHGGQMHIPFLGSVINPPGYSRSFSYGEIKQNSNTMFVSCGLGSAYTPARFCMKPEVVFVTLRSPHKNQQ